MGPRDPLLREIIAKDVKARGGKGRGMTRGRTLHLPALLGTLTAAVLVACAVALLAVSREADATFPGKNGRIAYASEESGPYFGSIYTINPGGGGKFNVTDNGTGDYNPSWGSSK